MRVEYIQLYKNGYCSRFDLWFYYSYFVFIKSCCDL